jgi:hypothetical protein
MGQPVCRGLRPVSADEGILGVEDTWVSADPKFQYTPLAWNSPRQVVVLARYYQSASHRRALVYYSGIIMQYHYYFDFAMVLFIVFHLNNIYIPKV